MHLGSFKSLENLELHSAIASTDCSACHVPSNLPPALITRRTHANHEEIVNGNLWSKNFKKDPPLFSYDLFSWILMINNRACFDQKLIVTSIFSISAFAAK